MSFLLPLSNIPHMLLFNIFRKFSIVSFFRLYQANTACRKFVDTNREQRFMYCSRLHVSLVPKEYSGDEVWLGISDKEENFEVSLKLSSLAEEFRNAGLNFLRFFSIDNLGMHKEYREILLSFICDVNLQCTILYYGNFEWIEWLRPETVTILSKKKDYDYDYLRRVNSECFKDTFEDVCINVGSDIPMLWGCINETVNLGPFFQLLREASTGMNVNQEMIFNRRIDSKSRQIQPTPPFDPRQLMIKLDDLFRECPGLRDYNIEKLGDVFIMHLPVKGKGTFIVMYTHNEKTYTNVIGYKMMDNFKEFVQFYIRFYQKGYIGKSLTMLYPTDEWKYKFGLY